MILKTCKFCNNDFETRYTKKDWCNNDVCLLARKREKYEADIRQKTCRCGNKFFGTRKGKICEECTKKIKHNKLEEKLVNVICKKCGNFQYTERLIREIHASDTIKTKKLCNKCLEKGRIAASESKRGELNPNYKHDKPIIQTETREEMSERMKVNNPMFRKDVRNKVAKTFKEKIKKGEIKYKTGKDHHLYKGNRKRSFILRSRLKPWIKKWLEFYDYTCNECQKRGGKLEVHHVIPFRDIISKYTDCLNDLSYEEFEYISELIIKEHENIEGITYCKECHSKIDNFRKIKIDENQINKN